MHHPSYACICNKGMAREMLRKGGEIGLVDKDVDVDIRTLLGHKVNCRLATITTTIASPNIIKYK